MSTSTPHRRSSDRIAKKLKLQASLKTSQQCDSHHRPMEGKSALQNDCGILPSEWYRITASVTESVPWGFICGYPTNRGQLCSNRNVDNSHSERFFSHTRFHIRRLQVISMVGPIIVSLVVMTLHLKAGLFKMHRSGLETVKPCPLHHARKATFQLFRAMTCMRVLCTTRHVANVSNWKKGSFEKENLIWTSSGLYNYKSIQKKSLRKWQQQWRNPSARPKAHVLNENVVAKQKL